MRNSFLHFGLAILASLMIFSCSSDGDIVAGGGVGGTGISTGSITGFGSIFVNGVEFDTTEATILIDETVSSESDLALGMVVTVKGFFNADGLTGVANLVTFDNTVEGAVQSVNLAGGSLTVLNQVVFVDSLTVFQGVGGLESISPGDLVELRTIASMKLSFIHARTRGSEAGPVVASGAASISEMTSSFKSAYAAFRERGTSTNVRPWRSLPSVHAKRSHQSVSGAATASLMDWG